MDEYGVRLWMFTEYSNGELARDTSMDRNGVLLWVSRKHLHGEHGVPGETYGDEHNVHLSTTYCSNKHGVT